MPFKVSAIHPPPSHNIQSDNLMRPPGTPDTPHGENHPINEQEFGPSGSVYGPIGSSTGMGVTGSSASLLSRSLSSTHNSMVLSYTNSPLSPRLLHPAPPPNMKVHPSSDIWVPHLGSGPRMTGPHPMSQVPPPHHGPSYGVHPHSFPGQMASMQQQQQQHNHVHHTHHHQHTTSYPHVIHPGGHKHPPDAPHMMSRVTMGDHQHHPDGSMGGVFIPPNVGIRHGYGGGGDDYGMGNGNRVHKRWSVPSFSHVPQPAVTQFSSHQMQRGHGDHPHTVPPPGGIGGGVWSKPAHSSLPAMETRSLESGINGQPSGFEPHFSNTMYSQGGGGGGGLLSLSDPWASHWSAPSSGGPGFSNPPSLNQSNGPVYSGGNRGDGGMKVSVGASDPSWTSAQGPGSSEEELEVNSPSQLDGVTELFRLMKSLDINFEHIQSLKVCHQVM